MSIWSSIGATGDALEHIPDRCNYTGDTEPKDGNPLWREVDPLTSYGIDVATATSWHNCVRLSLDEWHDGKQIRYVSTMLDPAEVELLITQLTNALDRIKTAA